MTIRSRSMSRRRWLRESSLGASALVLGCASTSSFVARAASVDREALASRTFDRVRELARRSAARPFRDPGRPLTGPFASLDYDTYRGIRYRPERSIFRGEGRPFEVQLFHRGMYSRDEVVVHVVDGRGDRTLPFRPEDFEYPRPELAGAARDLGFAGLRLHAPMNRPDYFDEVAVFLGASYFRSLGRDQSYGLSCRSIAIDTGEPGGEEFPRLVELWLIRPEAGDERMNVVGLLEGASLSGAYRFAIEPGRPTTFIDVSAQLFFRHAIRTLGLAPLTSMYLFGEDEPARFGDFRPEVHDSDGLALAASGGERIFRPLRNPLVTTVSTHRLDAPRGYGLMQRDRRFASYEDLEARYERRPSVWVEPRGSWGAGAVRLLEIATPLETDDNVVATWVPDQVPRDELAFSYRLHFGDQPGADASTGRFVATRIARSPGRARFVLEAEVPGVDLRAPLGLDLVVSAARGAVEDVRVEPNVEDGTVRATFVLVLAEGSIESDVRAFLRRSGDAVSETWTYLYREARP